MNAEVVICGAGIAGVATAYHLAVRFGVRQVILVDERPPLSLTSDKSTECYRNWWPGPDGAMVRLMNRSIDLLEDLAGRWDNHFHLNRRGYLFATADPARAAAYQRAGELASRLGAGPLRSHAGESQAGAYRPSPEEGFLGVEPGADLILDQALIRGEFPYLAADTLAVLHVRRAGWLSAQQLGMALLNSAREAGVQVLTGRLVAVEAPGGRVQAVRLADGRQIETPVFVNAAGPFLNPVGQMIGVELPVFNEAHLKLAFRDHLGAVPRQAPLLIWGDAQPLDWTEEERQSLTEDPQARWLLETFPSGVHARPEGGRSSQTLLVLWEYNSRTVAPRLPIPVDPLYAEIVLRGLSRMIPAIQAYVQKLPQPTLDGGYYTKTQENRPLAGPLPVEGAYVIGALSGFGIMSAPALGELLAQYISGAGLPDYAPAFSLMRYQNPAYQAQLQNWGESWQI